MGVYLRRLIKTILLGIGLIFAAGSAAFDPAGSPQGDGGRIDQQVLEALQSSPSADYILVFDEQPDLSGAYQIGDWVERGQYVLDALRSAKDRSQKRALAELNRRGLRHRSFLAGNEIYVYGGDMPALQALLDLPEVARVRAPVTARIQPAGFWLPLAGPADPQAQITATTDWGITDTKADQFWSEHKRSGEGIIVANIDTGVDASHPALAGSYRCAGGSLTSPECWYDPTGKCNGGICDDHGHGTHTMGTMAASNDPSLPYTVGMAPGAEWIACKACTKDGNCADDHLLACADWILAPGGDPANRPHVVNNSWGDVGGDEWFAGSVAAWRAAGIFPAFSAGNYGACESLGSPGDYPDSFSSAAHASNRVIASFSSKGPGQFGDNPYTKPNLSAPGVSILSSWPANIWPYTWAYSNGTSMASPHSAGAVALLWSCNSGLIGQVDATFQVLQTSADPAPAGACGAPASGQGNYTYGYGYLNVLAAGDQACMSGIITGTVSDAVSGEPVAGASLSFSGGVFPQSTISTAQDGSYEILLPPGTYSVYVSAYGYRPQSASGLELADDQVLSRDFQLEPASQAAVSGLVSDGSGHGWPLAARLTYASQGREVQVETNPADGHYLVQLYQQHEYDVRVEAIGQDYLPLEEQLEVLDAPIIRDYALQVNPATCAARGYARLGGVSEAFESLGLPSGWSVADAAGSGQVWAFNDPGFRGNRTGGSGGFASVDALLYSPDRQDTSLVTPLMNFIYSPAVSMEFKTDLRNNPNLSGSTRAAVEVSLDGGLTWNLLWQWTNESFTGSVSLDLSGQAGGRSNVQVRFHFVNTKDDGWWQVDDVQITPLPSCLKLNYQYLLFPIYKNAAP
jgi:hypothetical protein